MALSASQQAFINAELPYATAESARTGIPVSVFLTQSANETGWGSSGWFTKSNNPAGIGVTGQPGKGNVYPSLAAAFTDYANKLLGKGEAGQQQFAADVAAHKDPLTLLADLEAAPWAAGHYGGHGLEQLYAANPALGAHDLPGTSLPSSATINAILAGTFVLPPSPLIPVPLPLPGPGGVPNPLAPITSGLFGPIIDFVKSTAIRAALVFFGAVMIVVGVAVLIRGGGPVHLTGEGPPARKGGESDDEYVARVQRHAYGQGQTAGAKARARAPRQRAQVAAAHGRAYAAGARSGAQGETRHPIRADVAQTAKGAEEAAAG